MTYVSVRMNFLFFAKYKDLENSQNLSAVLCLHRKYKCDLLNFAWKKEASHELRKALCPHQCAQESSVSNDVEGTYDFSMAVSKLFHRKCHRWCDT